MSNSEIKRKTEDNSSTEITKIAKEEIPKDHDQEEYQDTSLQQEKKKYVNFFFVKYQ